MNNEVEAYVGELRELRAREVKLAKLVTVVEEHLQGGVGTGDRNSGAVDRRDVERVLNDPDIANWMDRMRQRGLAPIRRFSGVNADRGEDSFT